MRTERPLEERRLGVDVRIRRRRYMGSGFDAVVRRRSQEPGVRSQKGLWPTRGFSSQTESVYSIVRFHSSLRRKWQTFAPNLGRSRDRKRVDRDLVLF